MSDRMAAAEERADFYEAAGYEPGELITTTSRIAFGAGVQMRSEWEQAIRSSAAPSGLARLVDAKATLRAARANHEGQDRYHFNGVASVTDTPYEMYDWMGCYDEIIKSSAFTETLASNPDVSFLVNHKGVTMARTKSGTLTLSMGDTGLVADAFCNPTRTDVSDLAAAIGDGDVDEMSFAFMLEEGRWSEDYTTFTITKLDINRGDVSAVNYGANPYTSIAARTPSIIGDLRHLNTAAARKAIEVLNDRGDIAKLDRLAEAFALVDREADAARALAAEVRSGARTGFEEAGRSIAEAEAQLLIDAQDR